MAALQEGKDLETDGPCRPSSVACLASFKRGARDEVLLYTYTGGTTKHSKCVVVTHAMALWEMRSYHLVAKLSNRDRAPWRKGLRHFLGS